jgi:hypothetical protein
MQQLEGYGLNSFGEGAWRRNVQAAASKPVGA